MSAQAGIFYFDRRPIDPELPKQLSASIAEYGPDGCGQHVGPGLVMVHRALHVTPEDPLERQPHVSKRGNVMTWDGRLDNRDDLLLQLWRDLEEDRTDVALAMAIYEKWGAEGFSRLIGDWSLAIWETETRLVTLASDYMGNRPLYVMLTESSLSWSTDLGGLVTSTKRAQDLDQQFIVCFLTLGPPPDLTPYRGVTSLTPGHYLAVSAGTPPRKRRFWDVPSNSIRYQNDESYESHLRCLLQEAVKVRLRAKGQVWAELSGGLDSSAIVCLASRLVNDREVPSMGLRTVSRITDHSVESDERRFIQEVERHCGIRGLHARVDDGSLMPEATWITPATAAAVECETARAIERNDGRVLLSGRLGDTVMGNFSDDCVSLADPLYRLAFREYLTGAVRWSRATRKPFAEVVMDSLLPFLPSSVQHSHEFKRALSYFEGVRSTSRLEINGAFSLQSGVLRDVTQLLPLYKPTTFFGSTPGNARLLRNLHRYSVTRALQSPVQKSTVQYTYPYAHRPLVEFVIAIPPSVHRWAAAPRRLMRRACRGFMPTRILQRFSKGYAEPMVVRDLRRFSTETLNNIDSFELVQRGYVDGTSLRRRLVALSDGSCATVGNVRQILAAEVWLRELSKRATNGLLVSRRAS